MRNPTVWKVAGILVLAIIAVNVMLGINLLPSFSDAGQKGTFAALLITWGIVAVGVFSGLALALFLLTARKPAR
jgi:hypothetical protein